MTSLKEMFRLWHLYRAGRLRHGTLRKKIERDCWSQVYNIFSRATVLARPGRIHVQRPVPMFRPTRAVLGTAGPGTDEQSLRHPVILR
jgi:hypothetical protein